MSNIIMNNYGYIFYNTTVAALGMRITANAVFINNGVFNVSSPGNINLNSGSTTIFYEFVNNGFVYVYMTSGRIFDIKTKFTNNGDVQIITGNLLYLFLLCIYLLFLLKTINLI